MKEVGSFLAVDAENNQHTIGIFRKIIDLGGGQTALSSPLNKCRFLGDEREGWFGPGRDARGG